MSGRRAIGESLATSLEAMQDPWGWFVALGMGLIIVGVICMLGNVMATLATVLAFGCLLIVGAVVSLVQAMRTRTWGGFSLYLLSTILRGFTGCLLIRYPITGQLSLPLLASFFIVGGTFRAIGAVGLQFPKWGWTMAAGATSAVLGVMLLIQLPTSSLWFIGFAIGVDFVFDGVSLIAVGRAVHSVPAMRTAASI